MSKEQEFFKKLEDKAESHPLKDRLEEELKDHAEDSAAFRKQSIEQSVKRLGTPRRIIKELRDADVSWKRFGIFTLFCGAVLGLKFAGQLAVIYLYPALYLSYLLMILNVLVLGLPLGAAIVLAGKRFHFSIAELFWYGFVFEIALNSGGTVYGYFFNRMNIIELVNQGVVGWMEMGILSFLNCVLCGVWAVIGGLLRKGWGGNKNNIISFYLKKIMKRILKIIGIVIGSFVAILLLFGGLMYYINGGETPEVGDSLERVLEIADKRQHTSSKLRRIAVDTFEVGDDERLKELFQSAQMVLEGKGYNVGVSDYKPENYGYILYKENGKVEREPFPVIENKVFMFSYPSGIRNFYIVGKDNKVVQILYEG